jgi:hypothetical protein
MVQEEDKKDAVDDDDNSKDARGGIRFGSGVGYEDAFAAGQDKSEYVTELPTAAEERNGGGGSGDDDDELDEGRVSSHPSTMAGSNKVREAK